MSGSDQAYWIVVGSPENFAATRAHGFTVQGLKSRHRKKAETMRPGDKIVWYITGHKAFAGYATITTTYFEDHTPIWKSRDPKKDAEDYPWRVGIRPDVTLAEDELLPAEPIARNMEHVAKWPAANWTLAFQGNVHKISRADFELIASALEAAAHSAAAD